MTQSTEIILNDVSDEILKLFQQQIEKVWKDERFTNKDGTLSYMVPNVILASFLVKSIAMLASVLGSEEKREMIFNDVKALAESFIKEIKRKSIQ